MDGDTLVGGYRSVEGALHGEFEKLRDCSGPRGRATFFSIGLALATFFDRGSRSEGGGQILLVGAKVGRRCRSSRAFVARGSMAWVDSQFGGMGGVVEEGE